MSDEGGLRVFQPDGWEIYGRPSEEVIDTMREAAAASGVALTLSPSMSPGSST